MKRTILLSKQVLILAFVLTLSFTSCKKGWWGYDEEDNGGGGNGGGNNTNINVKGTMYYQNCGLGIYEGNLWIRTDDGELLQPCEAKPIMCIPPPYLKDGDRVELNYNKFKGAYPSFSPFCKMAPFPFTKISINSIGKIQTTDCSNVDFPANYKDIPAATIHFSGARIEGSKLIVKMGFSGCNNETSRFKLIASPTEKSNVLTYEVKVIDNSALPVLCEAYFIEEVCFDISAFKHLVDGFVKVKIEGYQEELTF